MSVLVDSPMSQLKQAEVMRLDITDVTSPLPEQVRQRWGPYKQRQLSKPEVTLEQIQARMASADTKRQEVLRWMMTRAQPHTSTAGRAGTHSQQERARRLEAKLATAEAKRQATIDGKRSRATFMLNRAIQAADRLAKKQSDAALKTESSLRSAQAHRQARLAATSAAAQGAARGSFLQRRAFMRVWLRRQACSRKLQRMWRAFADRHQTSRQLAVSFIKTGVPNVDLPPTPPAATALAKPTAFQSAEQPRTPANTAVNTPTATPTGSPSKVKGSGPAIAWVGVKTHVTEGADLDPSQQPQDAFEKFAKAIQSPATLRSSKALLTRLEAKITARSNMTDISPLMQRLFPKTAKAGGHLERYPARVFLCAYMVQSHPGVVFNTQGELEHMLAAAGSTMLTAFEALLSQMAQPMHAIDRSDSTTSMSSRAGLQGWGRFLDAFDQSWAAYLQRFVAWKFADAAVLESELIKVAIEMEASVLSKTSGDTSPNKDRSEDLQAVIDQVRHDHSLLKERVARLGGPKATARLEAGLAAARAAALAQSSSAPGTPSTSPNSSPAKTSTSSGTVPNSPEAFPARTVAGAPVEGDENEGMAWELLYNLQWQLPTEELEAGWKDATGETAVMKEAQGNPEDNMAPADVASHVQRRVRRIAEQAFWDSVQAALAESGSGATHQQVTGQLAGLLAHMGQELMTVLPEQATAAREQLATELDEGRLQEALTAHQGSGVNGIDTTHLLSVLEHTAQLLKDMGAPAREAAAVAAQAAIRAELSSALQAGDSPALAAAVVKAVRVLMAQLKMLRMDAANFRLKMLAQSLKDGAGIRYAQGKFESACGVSQDSSVEQMSSTLPHTKAWLALVSGQVPQLAQHLQALTDFAADTNRVQAAANASMASAVPTTLRSGLRASPSTAAGSGAATDSQTSAAQLIHPVQADSWRGIVRLGLVHLIQGEIPVGKTALAETLRLDAQRLHLAQNDFQQLVVLAACMLLLQQSLAGQPESGVSMPEVADMKRRLMAILADPSMRLPDLAAELSRLAGAESDASSQTAMEAALNRMLLRSSGAFKALSSGIGNAIQLQLLASPTSVQSDAGLQQAVSTALARCGAVALKAEVAQLALRLSQTAALTEAVHNGTYQKLLSDLL